jgi:hypothetical protein
MHYMRNGQPVVEDRTQFLPSGSPLTALAQRSVPEARHLVPEARQYRQIPRNRMVLVVTAQHAPQPFSDRCNRARLRNASRGSELNRDREGAVRAAMTPGPRTCEHRDIVAFV